MRQLLIAFSFLGAFHIVAGNLEVLQPIPSAEISDETENTYFTIDSFDEDTKEMKVSLNQSGGYIHPHHCVIESITERDATITIKKTKITDYRKAWFSFQRICDMSSLLDGQRTVSVLRDGVLLIEYK